MNKLIKKNYQNKVRLLNEKRFKIISTIIKRDKYKFLKLYTLLIDIQFYLDKFNIKYWAIKGTLLGIIRNSGIIPWDDNINLCILYDDFCLISSNKFNDEFNNSDIIKICTKNEILFYDSKFPNYFIKLNWIIKKEQNFELEIKTFGPINLYVPNNYKIYLKNYYRNINFGIITQSNSSKLLQNYINILKYYNINYVYPNEIKFLKYQPDLSNLYDFKKNNTKQLSIDDNLSISDSINDQSDNDIINNDDFEEFIENMSDYNLKENNNLIYSNISKDIYINQSIILDSNTDKQETNNLLLSCFSNNLLNYNSTINIDKNINIYNDTTYKKNNDTEIINLQNIIKIYDNILNYKFKLVLIKSNNINQLVNLKIYCYKSNNYF